MKIEINFSKIKENKKRETEKNSYALVIKNKQTRDDDPSDRP